LLGQCGNEGSRLAGKNILKLERTNSSSRKFSCFLQVNSVLLLFPIVFRSGKLSN
jgi:hypothetical protein